MQVYFRVTHQANSDKSVDVFFLENAYASQTPSTVLNKSVDEK